MSLFVVLLAFPAFAAPPAATAERLPRLYLVSEGERSGVPEKILWSLCELIKSDPHMRDRYSTVGVYRVAPQAVAIAEQRARDPALARLVGTRDLLESADRRFAESHYCLGKQDTQLTAEGDPTPAELLWVE